MNITAINNTSPNFGAKIVLAKVNSNAKQNLNLMDTLYKINPNSKTSLAKTIENYAEKHGFKEVLLRLDAPKGNISPERKLVAQNDHCDILTILCDGSETFMPFSETTSERKLSANILGTIQEAYNSKQKRLKEELSK